MKKIILIAGLLMANGLWAEVEFNLDCTLIEKDHIVEKTEKGPKFKSLVAGEWVNWTGEIQKNKSEQDLAIKPKVKEYQLQVIFDEDLKGYIYSRKFTDGDKKKIKKRASRLSKNTVDLWTKGIFLRSEHIIINRQNGYISFVDIKSMDDFLGSCISANS